MHSQQLSYSQGIFNGGLNRYQIENKSSDDDDAVQPVLKAESDRCDKDLMMMTAMQ